MSLILRIALILPLIPFYFICIGLLTPATVISAWILAFAFPILVFTFIYLSVYGFFKGILVRNFKPRLDWLRTRLSKILAEDLDVDRDLDRALTDSFDGEITNFKYVCNIAFGAVLFAVSLIFGENVAARVRESMVEVAESGKEIKSPPSPRHLLFDEMANLSEKVDTDRSRLMFEAIADSKRLNQTEDIFSDASVYSAPSVYKSTLDELVAASELTRELTFFEQIATDERKSLLDDLVDLADYGIEPEDSASQNDDIQLMNGESDLTDGAKLLTMMFATSERLDEVKLFI